MFNLKIAKTDEMNFAVTIMPEHAILIYHYEKNGLFKLSEEKVILEFDILEPLTNTFRRIVQNVLLHFDYYPELYV